MNRNRRRFLKGLAATSTAMAAGPLINACSYGNRGRVVIVGGGFGGATCAKYLRRLNPVLEVTLVEPKSRYVTCPFSNLVLGGLESMDTLVQDYRALADQHGVRVIHDRVRIIESDTDHVRLAGGERLPYDRLVLSPGISFMWNAPEGYTPEVIEQMPHAWEAGRQTEILRDQIRAMPDGGVVGISIPPKPFRCPPGPYERASLIAHCLKQHKPRAKLLLLDGNETFSKQDVFEESWARLYPGMIERLRVTDYGGVTRVDPATNTLYTETDSYQVDVANVIPSQQAGQIAVDSGLADRKGWCSIQPHTFESALRPNIHIIGDAIVADPIPKSASAANSQAKHCALAVAALLAGGVPPKPSFHNTCYSIVAPGYGFSVSGIYEVRNNRIHAIPEAGGVSPLAAPLSVRQDEAGYAHGWYVSITADSFH